ncbi:enoyl-CoA hydratase-related protein [Sphingomonas sp. MG17]|uniref:Enoyl-CoA hydratase-related protein n=1 Tax=Sphingomonas tagetis TaxID=2949092 RepID=A0A9X2KL59_9SPHN|nr:enoyl-CoA hydratase-related protein [Sphingomonas tagetis]
MTPVTSPVALDRVAQHVAVVTIDRPDARNAINGAVTQTLRDIVDEIERDPEVWVVVLTGAGGKAFSAGADLREVGAGRIQSLMDPDYGFAGFVHAPRRKVWIAAIEGFALAGGFELVLACDLAVASETSSFGLPEVKRGLIASAGGLYRIARALPKKVAIELVATSGQLSAGRAFELGLLSRLAPAGGALATAIGLAEEICANSPLAVRESVAVARAADDLTEAQLRQASEAAQARIVLTEDFKEGPRAFVEKRAPVWVGR